MALVTLAQVGRTVEVLNGQTILATALAAGIAYPYGCRSGRCGACKSRLIQGTVDLLPHTPFALSPEERAEGLILACRALPTSDAGVAWLDGADEIAEMPVRRLSGRLVEVLDATHDIKLLRVALEKREGWDFRAGQHVRLAYPGAPARDYSMANRPDEEFIEFHVREVPGGAASQIIAQTAQVGDPLVVEGPFGSAFLREGHAGPILAVAGGSAMVAGARITERDAPADSRPFLSPSRQRRRRPPPSLPDSPG